MFKLMKCIENGRLPFVAMKDPGEKFFLKHVAERSMAHVM